MEDVGVVLDRVVDVILLGLLQDVLDLGFQFFLFLELFQLSLLLLCLLFFHVALAYVFLLDSLINDSTFLLQISHSANEVQEFEVRASLWALVRKASILIGFVCWFLTIKVSIIQHVYTDEVCHLIIHLLALTQLECKILILFILSTCLRVFLQVIQHQISGIIHDIGADSHQSELLATIHDVVAAPLTHRDGLLQCLPTDLGVNSSLLIEINLFIFFSLA